MIKHETEFRGSFTLSLELGERERVKRALSYQIMTTFIQRHNFSVIDEYEDEISSLWIHSEIEKAEESLKRIHSSLAQQQEHHHQQQQQQQQEEEEEDSMGIRINDNTTSGSISSYRLEALVHDVTLKNLATWLDYIDVSNAYLSAMKKTNGSIDIQDLLALESELNTIIEDHGHTSLSKHLETKSSTFQELIGKIESVRNKIILHIRARSILFIRKLLSKHTFPCLSASEFLVEEMTTNSGLFIYTHALEQVGGKHYVARELLRPITHRTIHHFLQSRTIPQNKLDKLPHLLLEYIRKLLLITVPVFEKFQVTNDALVLIYGLVQHILFRRGYYERIGEFNPVELSRFIQDILRFSKDVQEMIADKMLDSSLFDLLVCQNPQLWHWWLDMEYNQANHIFMHMSQDDNLDSLQERFHSLLFSIEIKVSFLNKVAFRSEYSSKVLVPSCTTYIDILAKRAKRLKEDVDSLTSLDVFCYMSKWMKVIDVTDGSFKILNVSQCSDMKSFAPSFQKLCDGMVEECTHIFIDMLFDRTTFTSFLMNASHLLSNELDDVATIEDVLALLSVWSKLKGTKKDQIYHKVVQVVSTQILSVILDESLHLTQKGCDITSRIIMNFIQELDLGDMDGKEELRRLQDILIFMQEPSWSRVMISLYDALGIHRNESLYLRDLVHDPAMMNQIETMIRSHYKAMTIDDALSIMQRLRGDV